MGITPRPGAFGEGIDRTGDGTVGGRHQVTQLPVDIFINNVVIFTTLQRMGITGCIRFSVH